MAGWIGVAYWFASSFANPAVAFGRMFSDTFVGVSPSSVPLFVAFQIVGAAVGAALVVVLYPDSRQAADAVIVPYGLRDPVRRLALLQRCDVAVHVGTFPRPGRRRPTAERS